MLAMVNILIVTYHYIRNNRSSYPGIHPCSVDQFNNDIKLLKKTGFIPFNKKSLSDLNYNSSEKYFIITFDDGLKDQFDNAVNILNDHQTNGIFFINSKPYLDFKPNIVNKYHWIRSQINPKEFNEIFLKELEVILPEFIINDDFKIKAKKIHIHDDSNIAIIKYLISSVLPSDILDLISQKFLKMFAISDKELCKEIYIDEINLHSLNSTDNLLALHGHSHEMYSRLTSDEIEIDLKKNIKFLKKFTNKKKYYFAYPYGRANAIPSINDTHLRALKNLNISAIFTLNSNINNSTEQTFLYDRITNNEINKYT